MKEVSDISIVKFLKNKKGISLVELLVAIAIVTIVVTPFMGSFIESTKNNNFSEDKLTTSMLAQKSLEEIKSNPLLLKSDSDLPSYKTYYESNNTKVRYKITKESLDVEEDNQYNIEKIAEVPFDIIIEVSKNAITINEKKLLFLTNPNLHTCYLKIEETDGVKNFIITDNNENLLEVGNFKNQLQANIKVQFLDNEQSFKLNVNADKIDNTSEEIQGNAKVLLYVVDDKESKFRLHNRGYKAIEVYNQVSGSSKNYSNIIYKIEVVVEKDNVDLNRLFSYVKKVEGE